MVAEVAAAPVIATPKLIVMKEPELVATSLMMTLCVIFSISIFLKSESALVSKEMQLEGGPWSSHR